MTLYLESDPGVFIPWKGQPIDGKRYGLKIASSWTSNELAAIRLYSPLAADLEPEDKITTNISVQRVNGNVKFVRTLKDRPIPDSVTMRQARLALHNRGLLSQVETALSALDEPERTKALIEWEYSTSFERNHPMVLNISFALNLTKSQVDDLFVSASKIE